MCLLNELCGFNFLGMEVKDILKKYYFLFFLMYREGDGECYIDDV